MRSKYSVTALAAIACALIALTSVATAAPYHTPTIDGQILVDGVDWVADDLALDDYDDDNGLASGNVRHLRLTWDQDNLYLGLYYQALDRTVLVYLDTGLGAGPADLSLLAQHPRGLVLPDGRHCDLLLGQHHTGFTNLGTLQAWRVDGPGGAVTEITDQTTNAQAFAVDNDFPGASVFWFRSEIAIPWSAVYPDGMPSGAVLRAVMAVTPGDAADSDGADDIAPGLGRLEGAATPIQIAQMHASILDHDGDGQVDALDGAATGTLTLQNDPGDVEITLAATLDSWTGDDLDWPVSTVTTAAGETSYRLGRLAPGDYTVTATAPGYFAATTTATVTAGQETAGVDLALEKATTITGSLGLEVAGSRGGFQFRGPDGAVLAERDLLPNQWPYDIRFNVEDSGDYRLEAWADNHLREVFVIPVTAGVDVTGLDLVLSRAPILSGVARFASGPGAAGEVSVANAAGDTVFASVAIAAGDTLFSFYAPRVGDLVLRGDAGTYAAAELPVTAEPGVDLTDLVLTLDRLPQVAGAVSFVDGPGMAGLLVLAGEASADTVAFPATGGVFAEDGGDLAPFFVPAGQYTLTAAADGYVPEVRDLVVPDAPNQTVDAGDLAQLAVRADRLRLLDADGQPAESVSATMSVPADDFYSYAPLTVEAVDAAGRRDILDLDAKLADLPLTARKLDDVAAPAGFARFLASEDIDDVVTTVSAAGGLARLWIANDAVEVLRVYVGPDVPDPDKLVDPPTARFMVGFNDPRPAAVVLTAARDTLAADGQDVVLISAQLYDSAANQSRLPDVAVNFSVAGASTGAGSFVAGSVVTNAEGRAQAELRATGAGALLIDAAVVVDGNVLEVRHGGPDGPAERLPITVIPGPTAAWRVELAAGTASISEPVTVSAQLVDAYGNPTGDQGVAVTFAAEPASLGGFPSASAVSDTSGRASASFEPAGPAGVVTLSTVSAAYPADPALLQLRDVTVETDPDWRNEPPGHQSFDTIDLTAALLDNTPDELLIEIPFSSPWGGVQLHVLLETQWDAAGAGRDPFEMPVNYGHAERPDYALTSKYSADDYGDFRRANGTAWEFWNVETGEYESGPGNNNIQGSWVTIEADVVRIAIPFDALGGAPDSLRCEVYATQEDGEKRSAFDSVPQDATLDLTFDYLDPQPGDWDIALGPVTLSAWSRAYRVKTDFPTPPVVTEARAEPAALEAGTPYTLTARVADAGDGVGDVLADLSATAGAALARMYDDGPGGGHGDAVAGDGTYSLLATVPVGSPGGAHGLVVTAYDATNLTAARDTALVDVTAEVEILRSTSDPAGDDHGPNQPSNQQKYYTYPTNAVFVPGGFDLLGLDLYETTAVVGGRTIEMIAFQVSIGDLPDPADPQTADWNPLYGELNIEKLDILIDSGPGGATSGLPNRRLDIEQWNAWDYAVIMDGWYKAIIPSLGLNSVDAWRENALRGDADILIVGDFDNDTVTALVSKAALGNPTPTEIEGWNIAVLMSSHDFGGEEVLGGIRWVNESRSEWNFGGGHYTDRDANIIDLLLSPSPRVVIEDPDAMPRQEEVLDYDTPAAQERLAAGRAACALAIVPFQDTGPPAIHIDKDFGELVRRTPLENAPIAYTVRITDDYAVDRASFRYRPVSNDGGWDVESPMGYVGGDLWTVDIPAEWLDENLRYSPVDSTRYFEFQVEATDASAEQKTTVSAVATMQVEKTAMSVRTAASLAAGDVSLRQVEGSSLVIGDDLRRRLVEEWAAETGSTLPTDSLATLLDVGWNLEQVPVDVRAAPSATDTRALDVTRAMTLDVGDAAQRITLDGKLPGSFPVTLHYMQDDLPGGGLDEQQVAVFEYHDRADRWVLAGGKVNDDGNDVTLNVDHAGTFGLFWAKNLGYDPNAVVSGISISPNPFSPNGDGLYDDTTISFWLDREASVTVEIYDVDGRRKRRIQETFTYSGGDNPQDAPRRIAGLTWDGRDDGGHLVPYGAYVMRLLVTYQEGGGNRTIGSNHALAVIR